MFECFVSGEMFLWYAECIQLQDKCHNDVPVKGHKLLPLS